MRVQEVPPDGRCLFCGKAITPKEGWSNKKQVEEFINNYGSVGARSKFKLGNNPVCEDCRGDIWAMAQDE